MSDPAHVTEEMERTLKLVLADIDVGGRLHDVGCEVVHHLDDDENG